MGFSALRGSGSVERGAARIQEPLRRSSPLPRGRSKLTAFAVAELVGRAKMTAEQCEPPRRPRGGSRFYTGSDPRTEQQAPARRKRRRVRGRASESTGGGQRGRARSPTYAGPAR